MYTLARQFRRARVCKAPGLRFVARTLVATAEGEKPIEDIQVGDKVYATDPETGESGLFTVTDTFSRTTDVIVEIAMGGDHLRATPEHPFWVEGKGWMGAGDLQPGDCVASLAGPCQSVQSIRRIEGRVTVYNFTVEGAHTYYVGQGQWWVHNNCRIDLRKALGLTDPNIDAHHIIPWELRGHPLVRAATEVGWNMNHAYNGIGLPDQFHTTLHAGGYNGIVKDALDDLYLSAKANMWSSDQIYDALMALTDTLRATILR